MLDRLKRNPMFHDLITLKGNERACLYTEPLFNIPYNLYAPYATLYMISLGVNDLQIGTLMTIGMVLQSILVLFSGVIVDKFGRRMTTLISDLISWSIPTFLWASAQNYWWFFAAAIFNSFMHVSTNSWGCLFNEDADRSKLVNMFTWLHITGLAAVFFAPLSSLFVKNFSLVPTMRVLYLITCVSMTAKFVILFRFSHETKQGAIQMKANRGVSLWKMMKGYKQALLAMLHSRATMMVLAILVLHNITTSINSSFFAILANKKLGVPEEFIAVFPMVRAVIMLLFIFLLQNRINRLPFKPVMLTGVGLYLLSDAMLIFCTDQTPWMLLLYILAEAFGFGLLAPRKESLLVMIVNPEDRAKICAIIYMLMIVLTSPFGSLAGLLSSINRSLPFVLTFSAYVVCGIVIASSKHIGKAQEEHAA